MRPVDVTPSARRLTNSLRDIGYDFVAALADLVDNSVAAGATKVDVEVVFAGPASYVVIADDGAGMTERQLHEALRFGTRRAYELGDLGRYGLGLKTASISQCRRITVVSRRSPIRRRLALKTLDMDHIAAADRWEVVDPPGDSAAYRALDWLDDGPGTVVLWEHLDRILPGDRSEGGWARRRLDQLVQRARGYLGMVFHRFLEREAARTLPLTITVNGEKVPPWNPFAPLEEHRAVMPTQRYEISVGKIHGHVTLERFLLPPRDLFSSPAEFERLSGPLKWNRQQGLYIYRSDRLIQGGGWCGLRAADEHTKLARAALHFQTDLDAVFQINVAKMRVLLPPEVRTLLERPLNDLCHRADALYRREGQKEARAKTERTDSGEAASRGRNAAQIGAALLVAALEAGEHDAFGRVIERLRVTSPELAASLGW